MDNNDHNNDSKITLITIDSNDDNGLIVKLSATFFLRKCVLGRETAEEIPVSGLEPGFFAARQTNNESLRMAFYPDLGDSTSPLEGQMRCCLPRKLMENPKHEMIFLDIVLDILDILRSSRHRWKWMFLKFDWLLETPGEVWRSRGQLRNNHPQSWPPESWRTKCHHGHYNLLHLKQQWKRNMTHWISLTFWHRMSLYTEGCLDVVWIWLFVCIYICSIAWRDQPRHRTLPGLQVRLGDSDDSEWADASSLRALLWPKLWTRTAVGICRDL